MEKVSTGSKGLDDVIDGGFQKASLILLAGTPGTGKTVFGAQFICRGVTEDNEAGVYISFVEDKKTFLRNMSKHLGRDCEACEKSGKCVVLDFLSIREGGVPTLLETILGLVSQIGAKRLVIDSYSAMSEAFKLGRDSRMVIQTILAKIVRQAGCTTILISEVPRGNKRAGMGIEEFVADGVMKLSAHELEGRLLREIKISKIRGTEQTERKLVYTLKGGFKAFAPFEAKHPEKPHKGTYLPELPGKFRTGSEDLDNLLKGGYDKGSTVLLEIGEQVSTTQYQLVTGVTFGDFLVRGRANLIAPSSGVDDKLIKTRTMEAGFSEDEVNRLVRVCIIGSPAVKREPCAVAFEGKDIWEDYRRYRVIHDTLVKETGQPVMRNTGVDSLVSIYGLDAVTKLMWRFAADVRSKEGLSMLNIKPGYEDAVKMLSAIADVHLKLVMRNGNLVLYGMKPWTNLQVVEMDVTKGHAEPKLTPIV